MTTGDEVALWLTVESVIHDFFQSAGRWKRRRVQQPSSTLAPACRGTCPVRIQQVNGRFDYLPLPYIRRMPETLPEGKLPC
jgi:hypothetical protein